MNRSKIEWCSYSINPVKGLCPMACSYCYARRMYKRFHWNPEIRADWQETGKLPNKPSRIFVGSTMELFGDWIKPEWMREIMSMPKRYPHHTFIFLTKQPQNLIKWSPFPSNCWVGVSAIDQEKMYWAIQSLQSIKAKIKFLSLEPLLQWKSPREWLTNPLSNHLQYGGVGWLIIGQQTRASTLTRPKSEWIQEIIDAADSACIPIFIKDNILKDKEIYWLKGNWNRQEFPKK